MEEHEDHGHSFAAWVAVGVILLGAVVGSIAVLRPSALLGWLAAGIIVVGAVSGKVLSMAGFGARPHDTESASAPGPLTDAPEESGTKTVGKS
ncbi:MAG TPA: HGxxPAAW family protein [Intrasporangium sp.]|uniref:HGxxPAAW family protein n=1 Tax=Intrasporangium sp. TaxID=1925024 RepID=UPI002D79E0F4|nr:HGxxPAAW family protein [Intrasporangium sp.]HET7398408.1 HGxxPAAW family protein [Intrasporangium sp.]